MLHLARLPASRLLIIPAAWLLAGALALASGACSSRTTPPATEAPASVERAAADGADSPATARPDAERIADTIARMGTIQSGLATLRGLPFKHPVEAAYQTSDEFRAYLKRQIARELPPDKSAAVSRSMYHLGFMAEKADLARLLEDAFVSQAGAYYDPDTKKFHFLFVPESPLLLDTLAAHELTHGLQDQHFDLERFVQPSDQTLRLDQDVLSARRFIVEGEATLMMIGYLAYSVSKTDPFQPGMAGVLRMQLEAMANMGMQELTQQQLSQSGMMKGLGPDFEKALRDMDKIPPFLLIPMLEAYTRGTLPVFEAFVKGGWPAVDALYASPPESTEQVLHPREKLIERRDHPVALALPALPALPALDGWEQIDSDVLGELLWRAYFETWKIAGSDAASAGWDGDRYAVYARGERTLALIATVWDSAADAEELERAYLASLAARFPGARPERSAGGVALARPDGTEIRLRRAGDSVYVVDGADPGAGEALLAALASGTRATRHPDDGAK